MAEFHWESAEFVITEQYEENTARLTVIQRASQGKS